MRIYGVDTEKKVTPVMVRDAIVLCFRQAHEEVLKLMEECAKGMTEEEIEKMKGIEIEMIVKRAFAETGGDFNKPTKASLIKAAGKLAEFAAQFRQPEIIEKHYKEIKTLIDLLKD
jgi:hypothetical protein